MTRSWLAALAVASAALAGCGGGGSSSTASETMQPVPVMTLAPAVHLAPAGAASGTAGTFTGIARDRARGTWYLIGPTDIAVNAKPVDLAAIGASVTLDATFKPAAGQQTIHGYGFKLLTDATPQSPKVTRGYAVFFEFPNRLDIFRQANGAYTDIVDHRRPVTVIDGAAHRLRVVVTRSGPSRIDIATSVDGTAASKAHDAAAIATGGTWGLTNLNNTSTALVTVSPAVSTTRP
jgi:hypothetical protein